MISPREKDIDFECWEWLASRCLRPDPGHRTSMSRFGGSYSAAKKSLPFWIILIFERLCLSIEVGFLQGTGLRRKGHCPTTTTTSRGRRFGRLRPDGVQGGGGLEDKSLHQCSQKAVLISMLTLGHSHHHRAVRSIVDVTHVLDAWRAAQSRLLRSVSETEAWVAGQASGDLMSHVCSCLKLLLGRQALSSAGLLFLTAFDTERKDRLPNLDMNKKVLEDEAANMFGQMRLSSVVQKVPRGLPMYVSCPHRILNALASDALAAEAIAEFWTDQAIWHKLVAKLGKNAAERLIERRHLFNLRLATQVEAGLEQLGFAMPPMMRELLVSRARGNVQTQTIEYLNGQNRSRASFGIAGASGDRLGIWPWFSRKRSSRSGTVPRVCLWARRSPSITRSFLGRRSSQTRSSRPRRAARSRPQRRRVLGTALAPRIFGPSAADVAMLRWLDANSSSDDLDQAWLGEACDFDHRLILALLGPDGDFEWHLALRHFQKSSGQ